MSDREADTIKTSIIGEAAMMIARIYKQHIWPAKYSRTFYLDTVRVRVVIDEHKKDETKAEIESERSIDA